MDNPAYVDQRMVGATPPNVYDLKPREKLFHGVAALRMTPVGENEMHGRNGPAGAQLSARSQRRFQRLRLDQGL